MICLHQNRVLGTRPRKVLFQDDHFFMSLASSGQYQGNLTDLNLCAVLTLNYLGLCHRKANVKTGLRKKWFFVRGLPWWSSGGESACQRRGCRFDPWSRRTPHAAGQAISAEPVLQSPGAATREASKREASAGQRRLAPTLRNWRKPALSDQEPAQP